MLYISLVYGLVCSLSLFMFGWALIAILIPNFEYTLYVSSPSRVFLAQNMHLANCRCRRRTCWLLKMCLLWFCMAKTKSHCVGSHSSTGEIQAEDLTHVLIFFWKKNLKLQIFSINVENSIKTTTTTEQHVGRANHTSPWACQVCQEGLCRLKGPVAPGLWVSFMYFILQPEKLSSSKESEYPSCPGTRHPVQIRRSWQITT